MLPFHENTIFKYFFILWIFKREKIIKNHSSPDKTLLGRIVFYDAMHSIWRKKGFFSECKRKLK